MRFLWEISDRDLAVSTERYCGPIAWDLCFHPTIFSRNSCKKTAFSISMYAWIKLSKVIPVWLGEALRIPFTCRTSQLKLSSGESSSVCSFEETLFSTSVSSLLIRESSILEPFEGGLTSGVFKYSLAAVVSKRSLVTLKQRLYDSVCGSFLIFVWRNLHEIFRDIAIENSLWIEISDLFVQKPGEVETWDYSCGHLKKKKL